LIEFTIIVCCENVINVHLPKFAEKIEFLNFFLIKKDGKLDFVEFFFLYDMSAREKLADLLSFWTHSMICWSDSPLILMPNNLIGSLICGGISGAVGRWFKKNNS
jgi:hypothetical protein